MSNEQNEPTRPIQPSTMEWERVVDESLRRLRTVAGNVAADDWDRPTPCRAWNVTQVVQHAAGDQLGWVSAMTDGPKPDFDPFSPSGTIDGEPMALVDRAVDASETAWATIDHDEPAVATPLPQGSLPAPVAAGACALDAAVHAWDIAVATGQPSPLTADLAGPLMEAATAVVEPLREWGAYAEPLPPSADDDPVTALLRYLGRDPGWSG